MKHWKSLRKLNTQEQLLFVESYLPDAYEYLTDIGRLPTFDDNDEWVKEDNKHDLRGGRQEGYK